MHNPFDIPATAPDALRQRLRLRRFLLAGSFSLVYLAVLAVFHTQDEIDRTTLLEACTLVAALILVFYLVFRLGLNLRFPDPSLTGFQVLVAMFTMLYVVYRAPDTRLVFGAFFFVTLMFGMLRSSGRQLTVLGCVALVSFALVT